MTLPDATRVLVEATNTVDLAVTAQEWPDTASGLICLELLRGVARDLSVALKRLSDALGDQMGTKHLTVEGAGQFTRSARREGSVKCTDEDGLWRTVLDHRVIDPETGEVLPQAEVILRAYGVESKETGARRLTGASPTKLDAIGIPSKLFFEQPDRVGWNVRQG